MKKGRAAIIIGISMVIGCSNIVKDEQEPVSILRYASQNSSYQACFSWKAYLDNDFIEYQLILSKTIDFELPDTIRFGNKFDTSGCYDVQCNNNYFAKMAISRFGNSSILSPVINFKSSLCRACFPNNLMAISKQDTIIISYHCNGGNPTNNKPPYACWWENDTFELAYADSIIDIEYEMPYTASWSTVNGGNPKIVDTVYIEGEAQWKKAKYEHIILNVGENIITIKIMAQDMITLFEKQLIANRKN